MSNGGFEYYYYKLETGDMLNLYSLNYNISA